ncbi:MAG: glycine--tRNA ligase subunit beta [Burkholderiales bacterium]|nr:glycine--tRNA ligase subunit beta [Burkholderiales bacterium]
MNANLLVELFTEELPPRALKALGDAFARGIASGLAARGLLAQGHEVRSFSTPRRLAVHISAVLANSPDREQTRKLMPAKVAFGPDGNPAPALLKRLEKEGYGAHADMTGKIERRNDGGAEFVFLHEIVKGVSLVSALQGALEEAVARLPVPKMMSYQLADGISTVQFVRPVHGLLALHGTEIVPVTILGLDAGRVTHGHRFQGVTDIPVASADAYEEALAAHGKVIAAFDARRDETEMQLRAQAEALEASLGPEEDVAPLLDEVTALVEYPTVYAGEFEPEFLAVPQECLVLTMRTNQKYFPLFDAAGKLVNRFLIVSNMRLADPKNIVEGNNRVVRPRLADARFFFETDKKIRLEARVPQLGAVVYHNKLGSQLERVERVQLLAGKIAREIGADPALAERAAWLAKADLVTNMVGEFPELQGVMGRYYAQADGEHAQVAEALSDQYRIRFDAGESPANLVSVSLFIADRVETLVGIWGIGLKPSGDKDPFGLRRATLGLINAFELLGAKSLAANQTLTLRLEDMLQQAAGLFKSGLIEKHAPAEIMEFAYERYRHQLIPIFERKAVDAVIALQPPLHEVVQRVSAVVEFSALTEAEALAAANKRIGNILKKADTSAAPADASLFVEPAEKALAAAMDTVRPAAQARFAAGDYAGTLKVLSQMRLAVDVFFDEVMVMSEDPKLQANRIALLRDLHGLMNMVADISKLAA